MRYGYNGKILHVNLTTGELTVEEPPESFYRKYMGGSALNTYYLLKEMPANADPLGPDNILALSVGVITGAPISGQSRMTSTAKSPLTDAIGDAQSGGFFPAEMKFAGFDAFIIKGQSSKPVYLWVHDGQYELRDASHLWGKITGEVEAILQEELGDKQIEVAQVGPASELGVRYGAIMNMSNRANGRTGMGTVMASKKLKAVVVRGKQGKKQFKMADPKGLINLAQQGVKELPESDVASLSKYGTPEVTGYQQAAGGLPSYNYNSGVFDSWEAIDGTTMYDTILRGADEDKQDRRGRDTCYACTIRCKRVVEITEGPYKVDPYYGGPEYETTSTFGNYCGVSDLPAVAYANQLCNQYGMDTISCGATIAWAMECFENGKLTLEDTDGLEVRFGNAEVMVKLTEMIAKREGFGNILAEGSARAAEIIGRGTEEYLITSRKQEAPAHMPQLKRSIGLIYAVNPFGADHQSSEHDGAYEGDEPEYPERLAMIGLTEAQPPLSLSPGKINFALKTQHFYSLADSVNVCQFVYGPAWQLYDPEVLRATITAVTGWDITIDELLTIGERRVNMLRAFNARDGIDREQDQLPAKMFKKALKNGPTAGLKLDRAEFEAALDEYFRQSNWDVETGIPTRHKLTELDLAWVADQLNL
ncbi:aldehyde ferredoxin oxidoreductase family protein [Anaerolineales bacterium HSG6]|nr:aldehyde ferredoxin oxidoreductase family protein [Anaerolineales bacterium HSG6]MDM8531927.1 aldehyde ferredoxin oxidoreductase family protein [Anaerolineales bacterium HSG25]